jgi:DNA-binding NtrC family response regulator
MSSKTKILFVDDEKSIRNLFSRAMMDGPFLVKTASDGEEDLKKLKTFSAEIVMSDVRMPRMDGLALLKEIRVRYPDIFVVIITGFGAIEDAVSAMKAGAYDYILKPFDFDTIRMLIDKITAHTRILEKNIFPGQDRRKNYRFENFIGQDPKMFQVFQRIIDVAISGRTVYGYSFFQLTTQCGSDTDT